MKIINLLMVACLAICTFTTNQVFAVSTADTNYPGATRTFTLVTEQFFSSESTWSDQLVSAGQGNITGNTNVPNDWTVTVDGSGSNFSKDVFQVLTGNDKNAGIFILNSNAWETYDRIAIGLKVGTNRNPDWAIFELAQYAQSGSWSTAPKQGGGLSHYMIYTIGDGTGNTPPVATPLPSAFWFFGASLLSLIGVIRKNKTC